MAIAKVALGATALLEEGVIREIRLGRGEPGALSHAAHAN